MSNSSVKKAQRLAQIAENIKTKKIEFTDIPLGEIVSYIQQVYESEVQKGEYFALLYGRLITKALEHSDYEELADVLFVLANHFVIFANEQAKHKQLQNDLFGKKSKIAFYENCKRLSDWNEKHEKVTTEVFNGKGVVYSAIIGAYDTVKEPEYVNPEYDYILYTDNPEIKSNVWQIRLIENKEGLDNVRLARKIKILGHEYLPEYDYSIWIDGKLKITDDLKEYVEQYKDTQPVLCFNHYVNDCIYQEMITCKQLEKDSPEIMEKQIERYKKEGYPEHNGLIESGLMVRELHNEKVKQLMKTWWEEIVSASKRDQLSFNYACWKNDFVYDSTDLYIYANKYVQLYSHN